MTYLRLWRAPALMLMLIAACSSSKDASKESDARKSKPKSKPVPDTAPPPSDESTADIHRIGDVGVIPLAAPDFDRLPLGEKKRVYALIQAVSQAETVNFAMAGPKILRTKVVLEGILKAKDRVPHSIREKISPYARRFFLNVGPVDMFTGERIRPEFIPGELAAAAKAALDSGVDLGIDSFDGADLGANRLEQLEALLNHIREAIYGPRERDETVDTEKKPNMPVPESPQERDLPPVPARLAASIQNAEAGLEEGPQKAALSALTGYLTSPSPASFSKFTDAFKSTVFSVETFIGPFGPPVTPEGARRFQGLVAVRDPDQSPILEKLAAEIPYFERRLPGNAMFMRRKKDISIPSIGAYHLIAAEPFGAVTRPAFRFPTPLGMQPGPSKAMVFTNVLDAEDRVRKDLFLNMLSVEGPSRVRRSKWRRAADTAFLALKYVVGFELGTRKGEAGNNDLRWLSTARGVLEEMHADLAALHFAFDPKLQKLGLIPEIECASAILDGYIAAFLAEAPVDTNPATPDGRAITARRIILRRLLNTSGVRVLKEDGRYVIALQDEEAFRNGIGELLAEVQRMVSLGEEKSGRRLIDEKGGALPLAWRQDVEKRFREQRFPTQWTYRCPAVTAKTDSSGSIRDVVLKTASAVAP